MFSPAPNLRTNKTQTQPSLHACRQKATRLHNVSRILKGDAGEEKAPLMGNFGRDVGRGSGGTGRRRREELETDGWAKQRSAKNNTQRPTLDGLTDWLTGRGGGEERGRGKRWVVEECRGSYLEKSFEKKTQSSKKKRYIRKQIRGRLTIADVGMGNAPPNGLYNTTVS